MPGVHPTSCYENIKFDEYLVEEKGSGEETGGGME